MKTLYSKRHSSQSTATREDTLEREALRTTEGLGELCITDDSQGAPDKAVVTFLKTQYEHPSTSTLKLKVQY